MAQTGKAKISMHICYIMLKGECYDACIQVIESSL